MKESFCPQCGNKITPNLKFCPKCGHKFVVNNPQSVINSATSATKNNLRPKKKKSLLSTLVTILALVMVAIAGGSVYYVYQQSHQGQNKTSSAKAAKLKAMDELSSKEWASLVITYAHNKYPHDAEWNTVYHDVKDGNANIEKTDEFKTDQGSLTPDKGQILYIVNNKTAFLIPNTTKASDGKVVLANSQETLGSEKIGKVYQAVKANASSASDVEPFAQKMTFYQNTSSSDGQGNVKDGFSDLECAVMAYVYKDSSNPEGQIDRALSACDDYASSDAYDKIPTGTGRYPNDGKNAYAISEGVDSNKFWVFKFYPDKDDVDITCHHNGKITFKMNGNRPALIKRYRDYKDKLDTLIKKINYNANHLDKLREKIDQDD